MTTYKQNYIGKGKEVVTSEGTKLDIVKVTIKAKDAVKFKHEFEGEEYITFEVARMQKPDDYDRTHTVYVTTKENATAN